MLKVTTLKKRQDFLKVANRGHKYVTPAFVVQIHPNSDLDDQVARVGYTASRKVGGAVQRNRAKRRLRALVRDLFSTCAKPKTDYVLIARYKILTRNYAEMLKDLGHILKNADSK